MKFRTEYFPEREELTLSPSLPVALVGSCFTDNIASRMRASLWRAENPLGTLFNPISIANVLSLVSDGWNSEIVNDSLFKTSEGMVKSWLFDSGFSAVDSEDCRDAIRTAVERFSSTIEKGRVVCVTFGTSWCYFLKRTGSVVSNCHKMSGNLFDRRRISVEEIVDIWGRLVERMSSRWPGVNLIFTVSPVRHLKDGFSGNFLSKATLALAVERICQKYDYCYYFPAFEILNDDLRDYRFYASDLVHPSEEGVDYIWEKFKTAFLDESGISLLKEGERLAKAISHRRLPTVGGNVSEGLAEIERNRQKEIEKMWIEIKARHELLAHGCPGLLTED